MNVTEIVIEDPVALRGILGGRFDELVTDTARHPDPRLIAMAADADSPQSREIASCLLVREATPGMDLFQ